jgi:hypothetical protein
MTILKPTPNPSSPSHECFGEQCEEGSISEQALQPKKKPPISGELSYLSSCLLLVQQRNISYFLERHAVGVFSFNIPYIDALRT